MGARHGAPGLIRPTLADEAVEHLLAARVLEVDFELVALDRGDRAVAELAVEHALAEREIVAALVAEDTADARASITRCGSELNGRATARCQPGPRVQARIDCAGPRWAKGSARSDHCARHRLSPPVIVVSSSMCALGNSATKRRGSSSSIGHRCGGWRRGGWSHGGERG